MGKPSLRSEHLEKEKKKREKVYLQGSREKKISALYSKLNNEVNKHVYRKRKKKKLGQNAAS